MPVAVSYPGVYIDEQRSGDVAISGVATSIALFIGMTQRGPLSVPRLVLNRTSFETTFGADGTLGEMPDQVRQFFLNGGGQAYVMRIALNARTATMDLENEFGAVTLSLEARDAGVIGNTIRATVDYDTDRPETSFNLTLYREETGPAGDVRAVDVERYTGLVTDPASARYVVDVLAASSSLATAKLGAVAATSGLMLGGRLGVGANVAAADGDLFTNRIRTAINNAIARAGAGATSGRFDISVDEKPYVTVALPNTVAVPADIQGPINTALAPLGAAVTVDTLNLGAAAVRSHALRITSNLVGASSSVRIRRANGVDDIAAELQWSSDDDALEVSGGANRRPMANGIVARLGAAAGDFTALAGTNGLLHQNRTDVTGLLLSDPSGPIQVLFALPAANRLYEDPITGTRTLAAGRASLDAIALALNNAFIGAIPARRWTAARIGYRLALTYNLVGNDVGPAVTVANNGAGAYDIGAAAAYLQTPAQANVAAYRLGTLVTLGFGTGTRLGSDGLVPAPADYDAAYEIVRREVDLFNLLILPRNFGPPGGASQTDAARNALWGPASAFCLARRAVLLVDPHMTGWNTADAARAGLPALRNGMIKDHAAVFWPRVLVIDPVSGRQKAVDPSGTVAGICGRIDGSRGVWKAPAGLEATLVNVRGVEWRMSNEENGVINPEALNAIRSFASGIVVWGSRTMDGFDNSGNTDYRYLPVRRTALFIEESLYRGLQFAIFEPNGEGLWAQIRLAAGAFMNGLFRQGAFAAQKTSDAYFVKCDSETTTVTDQALGQVNVLVGFAPLRPAEFVIVTVKQKAGQVQA